MNMSIKVADLLVDNMDESQLRATLKSYIESDYLDYPEHYAYEVAEIKKMEEN